MYVDGEYTLYVMYEAMESWDKADIRFAIDLIPLSETTYRTRRAR